MNKYFFLGSGSAIFNHIFNSSNFYLSRKFYSFSLSFYKSNIKKVNDRNYNTKNLSQFKAISTDLKFNDSYTKKPKYNFIKITISYVEFIKIKFIESLMLNLKLNSSYTIIFQYTLYEFNYQYMLGHQMGIIVKDKHDINYYSELYNHFELLLISLMDRYSIDFPDFITIHIKEISIEDSLIKNQISHIVLPKNIFNINKFKTNFNNNILPLSINEKDFGYLLEGGLKEEILKKLIFKLQEHVVQEFNSDKINIDKEINEVEFINYQFKNTSVLSFLDLLNHPVYNKYILQILLQFLNQKNNINKNFKEFNNYLDKSSYLEYFFNNYTYYKLDEKNLIIFLQGLINLDSPLVKIFISNNKKYIIISILVNLDYYRIVLSINTGKLIFISKDNIKEYSDNLLASKNKVWIRTIGNNSILLNNKLNIEAIILKIDLKKIKYKDQIKKLTLNNKLIKEETTMRNPNFGVFDIETFIDKDLNNKIYSRVFALGFVVNNSEPNMFYLTDYFNNIEDSNKLILKCLDEMLKPQFNNFIFYVHNLAKFDVIFLQKVLLDYNEKVEYKYKVDPLHRDNKIIKLNVSITKNKQIIKIIFVDSLNLLNNSLENLCLDYNVKTSKGIFPYSFVNKFNLNYIGDTPSINYYSKNINIEFYNLNFSSNWSLREETLKYLKKDLLSLLEILKKFQEHLWFNHNIEMTHSLTISSLARIKFLKYYLKDSVIPLINQNNLFQFIYASYYGGITEVYKPYGKNLIYLDVNSLYPFSSKNPLPGNKCFWMESYNDKGLDIDKLFGVFYAEVETNDLYLGLLPIKSKTGTIFPNGKISGIWNTVDLKYAKKKGYKIKIIKGYQFNEIEDSPFNEYVDELSLLKNKLKGSQRQVVKSLLNNLLGRFALNYIKPVTKIVKKENLDYIISTKEIKTFKEINENNYIVTYIPVVNKDICESHNLDYHKVILNERKKNISENINIFQDTSIVISSFVNSYARIYMHEIKFTILQNDGIIYYSDTDSIITNLTLDKLKLILPKVIGNELGQLKLEYNVQEAYFITNKTYALLLEDGKTIIKAKGVNSDSLAYRDFEIMYKDFKSVIGSKLHAETNYKKGSVTIIPKEVILDWNSYSKREKVYNQKRNLWVDTKPLNINQLTKSLTIYNSN